MRIRESADGAVDGDQFEGDLLGDGHHDLLQLGLGAERDEPELCCRDFWRQGCGFIERAGGPWIENGGKDHFVFQAGAVAGGDGLQCLQRVGNDAGADDDVEWMWHEGTLLASSFQLLAFSFQLFSLAG